MCPLRYPPYGSAPHSLQDTDLVIVELSYESHLSYTSLHAEQASSRDYNANGRITQRLVENYVVRSLLLQRNQNPEDLRRCRAS